MDRMFPFAVLLLIMTICTRMSQPECQCGIFLLDSNNTVTDEVYLGATFPQACERLEMDQLCHDFCYETVVNITCNGDLSAFSSELGSSSGGVFCRNLKRDVSHQEVAGYYRWCQTSWKLMGIKAHTLLCCYNRRYVRCGETGNSTTTEVHSVHQVSSTPTGPDLTTTTDEPANSTIMQQGTTPIPL